MLSVDNIIEPLDVREVCESVHPDRELVTVQRIVSIPYPQEAVKSSFIYVLKDPASLFHRKPLKYANISQSDFVEEASPYTYNQIGFQPVYSYAGDIGWPMYTSVCLSNVQTKIPYFYKIPQRHSVTTYSHGPRYIRGIPESRVKHACLRQTTAVNYIVIKGQSYECKILEPRPSQLVRPIRVLSELSFLHKIICSRKVSQYLLGDIEMIWMFRKKSVDHYKSLNVKIEKVIHKKVCSSFYQERDVDDSEDIYDDESCCIKESCKLGRGVDCFVEEDLPFMVIWDSDDEDNVADLYDIDSDCNVSVVDSDVDVSPGDNQEQDISLYHFENFNVETEVDVLNVPSSCHTYAV